MAEFSCAQLPRHETLPRGHSAADREFVNRFGQLNLFLCHRVNHALETVTNVPNQFGRGLSAPRDNQFNSTVGQVSHESGHRICRSDPICRPPKADSLHLAGKQDSFRDF